MKIALFALAAFLFLPSMVNATDPDPRDSESPFGVLDFVAWDHDWNSHHYPPEKIEKAASLMEEAGIRWIRMDFLWEDIEPERGRFDFEKYDRIVDILSGHHVRVLGLLSYNASWASDRWNAPPDRALFVEYARQTVRHFKTRVRCWEIWNEPDEPIYWDPQDQMQSYALLLKEVYPALKAEDAACVVLLGGISKTISISLKRLYKLGCREFFDVVNIHPFTDPLAPEGGLQRLRGTYRSVLKIMTENGDAEKPIWFTEIGCPGVPSGETMDNWWLGRNTDENEQARWLEKVYAEALKWKGVKKIFWAFFRDTPGHFKNGIDTFGIVRGDFSKKPAFEAYRLKSE